MIRQLILPENLHAEPHIDFLLTAVSPHILHWARAVAISRPALRTPVKTLEVATWRTPRWVTTILCRRHQTLWINWVNSILYSRGIISRIAFCHTVVQDETTVRAVSVDIHHLIASSSTKWRPRIGGNVCIKQINSWSIKKRRPRTRSMPFSMY